jgi:hypothetical protein
MATFNFQGNDRIEVAVTNAASVLCDEYFKQNGMEEVAEEHTIGWYELQEKLRDTMLKGATNDLLAHFMIG